MSPAGAAICAVVCCATAPWQAAAVRRELPGHRPPPWPILTLVDAGAAGGLGALLPAALLPAAVAFLILAVPASVVDAQSRRLPNRLTLPGYPLLAVALLAGSFPAGRANRLLPAAAGAAAALLLYGVQVLAAPKAGPGVGDLKLSGLVGALLGWAGVFVWLVGFLAAHLLYLAWAAVAALHARERLRGHRPLGPALTAGAVLALAALAR